MNIFHALVFLLVILTSSTFTEARLGKKYDNGNLIVGGGGVEKSIEGEGLGDRKLFGFNDITKAVGGAAKEVEKGTNSVAKTVGNGASDAVQTVGNGASDAVQTVGNGASDAAETVAKVANDATKEIEQGANDAVDWIEGAANDVGGFFNDALSLGQKIGRVILIIFILVVVAVVVGLVAKCLVNIGVIKLAFFGTGNNSGGAGGKVAASPAAEPEGPAKSVPTDVESSGSVPTEDAFRFVFGRYTVIVIETKGAGRNLVASPAAEPEGPAKSVPDVESGSAVPSTEDEVSSSSGSVAEEKKEEVNEDEDDEVVVNDSDDDDNDQEVEVEVLNLDDDDDDNDNDNADSNPHAYVTRSVSTNNDDSVPTEDETKETSN